MDFSIDRIPGQWLFFARDWRPKSTAAPEALCVLTDAMDGLLHAQQTTSVLWKQGARLDASQQFIASFGVSQWQPANESIVVDQNSQIINYSYQADGQTCFRGSFSSILGPDDLGTCREPLVELGPQLTLHKLHQFHALFPWAERLWIYLSTVVTAHFLVDYLKDPSYEIDSTPPRMLGYKVRFDQRAIETRRGLLGLHPLSYSATTFQVGPCDAITLAVYVTNKLLMRIDLGLVKPSTLPNTTLN